MTLPMCEWPSSLFKKFPSRKVNSLLQALPLKLEWREGKPHGTLTVRTVIDAVIVSIQIDKLRGAEFRYCARSDCKTTYRIESRHKRIYCTPDCAHYMAVKAQQIASRQEQERQAIQRQAGEGTQLGEDDGDLQARSNLLVQVHLQR